MISDALKTLDQPEHDQRHNNFSGTVTPKRHFQMILRKLGTLNGVEVLSLNVDSDAVSITCTQNNLHKMYPHLIGINDFGTLYRAVSFERWEAVRKNGVDVEPTDSVIFCNSLEKAMEYGEWPKIIMGFDHKGLDNTFREVPSDIEENELNILMQTYPVREDSADSTKIWLSRLPLEDRRRNTGYEVNYAKWIPGAPWKSLKHIILADCHERVWDVKLSKPALF